MKMIKNFDPINTSSIQGLQMEVHNENPALIISTTDETVGFELKDAFSIFFCKDFLTSLNLVPADQVIFNNFEQFITQIDHISQLISINRILKLEGSDALAVDIFEIMLDAFPGQNLVTKAEQETDFHKYVMMALNKFNELYERVGA